MKLPENFGKKNEKRLDKSLRERANKSLARRKKQLRTKMILMNSAIALVIIMIVLVCKVVSLNKEDPAESMQKGIQKTEEKTKKEPEKVVVATPVPTVAPTPTPEGSARWVRKDLDPNKPMVALTFDDGPYAPVTKRILATLDKHNAKATFFCVGNRLNSYADTVRQAYNQGCQLASHTYSHVRLTKLKAQQIKTQVNKTNSMFERLIGCKSTALRPPGGFVNQKARKNVGVPMVCWSVDSEDWRSRNSKKILKKCKDIEDGDIVLMHDLYPTTATAVEKLVPRLVKQGYELVTVDEMFYYKGMNVKAGELHFSGK